MILKNSWLNITSKTCLSPYCFTFVVLGLVIMGSLFFGSFVGDEPMVNACWYLKEKCHSKLKLLQ